MVFFTGKPQRRISHECVANFKAKSQIAHCLGRRKLWKGDIHNYFRDEIVSLLILFIHSGLEGRGWKHLWLWRHCFGSRQNHQGKGPWQREIWSPSRNANHAKNWTSSKCCHFAGSLHRQRYYHFSFTFKDPYWKVLTLSVDNANHKSAAAGSLSKTFNCKNCLEKRK